MVAHAAGELGSGVPKPPSRLGEPDLVLPPWSSVSTVHWVTQWSSVMEIDGFMGRARSRSRAPQYLMKAMLAGAEKVVLLMRRSSRRSPSAPR